MTIREILKMGDPRLLRVAEPVKAFDTLGVEMDFAMLVARETIKQFGEGTLRAVPAINEG